MEMVCILEHTFAVQRSCFVSTTYIFYVLRRHLSFDCNSFSTEVNEWCFVQTYFGKQKLPIFIQNRIHENRNRKKIENIPFSMHRIFNVYFASFLCVYHFPGVALPAVATFGKLSFCTFCQTTTNYSNLFILFAHSISRSFVLGLKNILQTIFFLSSGRKREISPNQIRKKQQQQQ